MQGIAAITANNGWAMAAVGATIVICGLAILSFVISQLHKLIALMEKKAPKGKPVEESATTSVDHAAANCDILADLGAVVRVYQSLTAYQGESFPLTTLHKIFENEKIPHPHITIRELRDAGYLIPMGEGRFSWKNISVGTDLSP